jgi:hypothetical protein
MLSSFETTVHIFKILRYAVAALKKDHVQAEDTLQVIKHPVRPLDVSVEQSMLTLDVCNFYSILNWPKRICYTAVCAAPGSVLFFNFNFENIFKFMRQFPSK